jgi:tripartite-type tricarboxylate transporter receptor subunit TctC
MRKILGLWVAVMVAAAWTAGSATASYAQDFYKDKTVRFIVGYSAGGSFDLYTRVIAHAISPSICRATRLPLLRI